jgi:septation ring formation regulator EzrA
VVEAQDEAGGGTARFRRLGGNNRPQNNNNQNNTQNNSPQNAQPLSPVDQATEDLQTAMDDPNTNADVIKTRLDTLRDAKSKAAQDLTVARDQLRSVLTVRQEAVLVDRGILD